MKSFQPKTIRQNEVAIVRQQPKNEPFSAGMLNDLPASAIPPNAVSYANGYIPFPRYLEPAGGCKAWSSVVLPGLPGRTGYSWTKVGNLITKTVGPDFTSDDVGNFIVHDDGRHEVIKEYVDASRVYVKSFAVRASSSAGWVRGPVNAKYHHKAQNKFIIHIDTRLFVADILVTAYAQGYCISVTGLPNERSWIDEDKDNALIQTSDGLFRINLEESPVIYYRINGPVPTTLITAAAKTATKIYGYKYTYTLSRISGTDANRTRLTADSVLLHETGNCAPDTKYKDYGLVYNDRPVGDQSSTYYKVNGDVLAATVTDFNVIDDGQFKISIDGVEYNLECDFTGCGTLLEVAEVIQQALRTVNSSMLFQVLGNHFYITNPIEGGTLSTTSTGDSGTDISSLMRTHSGVTTAVAVPFTKIIKTGQLELPVDNEGAHTHYSVYRTLDVGENGIDPISGEGNNEEQFIWVNDIPIAKALIASIDGGAYPIVTATAGTFDPCDEGAVLRFADGTEVTLGTPAVYLDPDTTERGYIDSTHFRVLASGAVASQACAIGGDNSLSKPIRVFTGSQIDNTISIAGGITLVPADVGKTIWWANGLRSTIKEYVGGNSATAVENQDITLTGACMKPTTRAFTDSTDDETLRARITNFSLLHRFWGPLPNGDRMALVPGFIFVGMSGEKNLYYGQIPSTKEYLVGSYNPRQYTTFKDVLSFISEFADSIAVYCAHSTATIPTNTYTAFDVNGVVQVALISGQSVVDSQIGVKDIGGIAKLPSGEDWLVTNEPAIRIFNGKQFSDNLAKDRIQKILNDAVSLSVNAFYDPFNGISLHFEEPVVGTDTPVAEFTYELGEIVETLTADFTYGYDDTTDLWARVISFNNTSVGTFVTAVWSFADIGVSFSETDLAFEYTLGAINHGLGVYDEGKPTVWVAGLGFDMSAMVTLTVTDGSGNTSSVTKQVWWKLPPLGGE